jgi:hypothetical protein
MDRAKVLFLAANPVGTSQLGLDEEIRAITQKIRASEYRDCLDLVSVWAVRPDDLLQSLNEHQPQIVHFSGHGSPAGEIVLTDDQGRPKPVSARAFEALFTTLRDNVRVVLLNACFSQRQAQAIVQVIDCAIGMDTAIGDRAAITFAASFYRALGFGRSVVEAFEQGKVALLLEGIPEETTPRLLSREGVDLSTVFLVERDCSGNELDYDAEAIRPKQSEKRNQSNTSTAPDGKGEPTFRITGQLDAGIANLGGQQTFHAPITVSMPPRAPRKRRSEGDRDEAEHDDSNNPQSDE